MKKLDNLRAVLHPSEKDFGQALGRVLSAARPLQSEEFLQGRAEQLQGIERALFAPRRHVLIHGLRGVGKTSLAQTAAFKVAEKIEPIIVSCDSQSTFGTIIKDIFDEALARDPRITTVVKGKEGSLGFAKLLTGSMKVNSAETQGEVATPVSVNDAIRLIAFLAEHFDTKPVLVVDEFDLIQDHEIQREFANLVKQVSDKHVSACFIFCGIADSADALMAAHASADRYFHAVDLGKLPWNARFEIVTTAADALGIEIDQSTVIRIASISDGFPHYVHFLTEKLFWRVFGADNGGQVTTDLFDLAMEDAASAMDMKLRGPYEQATQKYNDTYSAILFAVADGHELKKSSSAIFDVYLDIMRQLGIPALDRRKYNSRMSSLKAASHARILSGSRQGWYEFTEKMIRGYVRLKAEQAGVTLRPDHPSAAVPARPNR